MKIILGTETEFGIAAKHPRGADPVSSSITLVNNYPDLPAPHSLWDYDNENPLLDARGFEADGERERPGSNYNRQLNKLLPNGGRLYVDGAHPEYSTPECANPFELIAYEKAGERILEMALQQCRALEHGAIDLGIYKNNSDGKGNSYGYHENYLVSRQISFKKLVQQLTPFLVTRQIFAGSGKVGAENRSEPTHYQISQRSDFFETLVDLNTMVKRPIINTRDEPHSDREQYRRLHVIVGDTNMSELSTYLKVGTMSLVLTMLEAGREVKRLDLDDPVRSMKAISRDLSLKKKVKLDCGDKWLATEIQRAYLETAERHFLDGANPADPHTVDLLKRWRSVLDRLDEDPMLLSQELDWVIKKSLIESFMDRKGCDWDDARVSLMNLQYHNVERNKGLFFSLERGGLVETLVTPEALTQARRFPPLETRAYFRGTCIRKFPKEIHSASWTSILFNDGKGKIKKVPLMDPWKGGQALVGTLLDEADTVEALLERLGT